MSNIENTNFQQILAEKNAEIERLRAQLRQQAPKPVHKPQNKPKSIKIQPKKNVPHEKLDKKYRLRAFSQLKKQKGYFVEYAINPRIEINPISIPDAIELVYYLIDRATAKIV